MQTRPFDKYAITEYYNRLTTKFLRKFSSFPGFIQCIFPYMPLVSLFKNLLLNGDCWLTRNMFSWKWDFDNYWLQALKAFVNAIVFMYFALIQFITPLVLV